MCISSNKTSATCFFNKLRLQDSFHGSLKAFFPEKVRKKWPKVVKLPNHVQLGVVAVLLLSKSPFPARCSHLPHLKWNLEHRIETFNAITTVDLTYPQWQHYPLGSNKDPVVACQFPPRWKRAPPYWPTQRSPLDRAPSKCRLRLDHHW